MGIDFKAVLAEIPGVLIVDAPVNQPKAESQVYATRTVSNDAYMIGTITSLVGSFREKVAGKSGFELPATPFLNGNTLYIPISVDGVPARFLAGWCSPTCETVLSLDTFYRESIRTPRGILSRVRAGAMTVEAAMEEFHQLEARAYNAGWTMALSFPSKSLRDERERYFQEKSC